MAGGSADEECELREGFRWKWCVKRERSGEVKEEENLPWKKRAQRGRGTNPQVRAGGSSWKVPDAGSRCSGSGWSTCASHRWGPEKRQGDDFAGLGHVRGQGNARAACSSSPRQRCSSRPAGWPWCSCWRCGPQTTSPAHPQRQRPGKQKFGCPSAASCPGEHSSFSHWSCFPWEEETRCPEKPCWIPCEQRR